MQKVTFIIPDGLNTARLSLYAEDKLVAKRTRDGKLWVKLRECNQCGDCIEVCPTEALYRDKRGIVRLRKKLCVGCLSCVGFCPYAVMFHHPDQPEPFKCVACGKCVTECPNEALAIIDVEAPPQ